MMYRMYARIKGQLTQKPASQSVQMSGGDLAGYEQEVNDSLHEITSYTLKALLPEKLHHRLISTDLSAGIDKEDGTLTAQFTIVSKAELSEIEKGMIESCICSEVMGGWGNSLLDRAIQTPDGDLVIWPAELLSPTLEWQPKYEITEQRHPKYPWLHRIKALADIGDHVMEGDYGGFVQGMENLSHDGGCWIYENSICCDNALVEGDAKLVGNAIVRDNAVAGGDAMLLERAVAEGNCYIRSGRIQEDARISGDAIISGQEVECGGGTFIRYPQIAGQSNVYGNISGGYVIKGNVMPHENLVNRTPDIFILEHGKWTVVAEPRKLEPPQDMQKQDEKKKQNRGKSR